MYTYMYLEVNMICLFILTVIIFKERHFKGENNSFSGREFFYLCFSVITIQLLDALWVIIDKKTSLLTINYIVCALYLINSVIIGYLTLRFAHIKVCKAPKPPKFISYFLLVPITVCTFLTVLSCSNGCIFYIEPNNNTYYHGELYFVIYISILFYLLVAIIKLLIYAKKEENEEFKKNYFSFIIMTISPMIFSVLKFTRFSGIPLKWPITTLSIFCIYITIQDNNIHKDNLTGIYNRAEFNTYLKSLKGKADKSLCVFLIDIDDFKYINDTYGHLEGDNALIYVSNAIQNVATRYGAFLARYGGDEFVVVIEDDNIEVQNEFKKQVDDELKIFISKLNLKYQIAVSIGSSKGTIKNSLQINQLIKEADADMYNVKSNK